jgi:hypothetical protein
MAFSSAQPGCLQQRHSSSRHARIAHSSNCVNSRLCRSAAVVRAGNKDAAGAEQETLDALDALLQSGGAPCASMASMPACLQADMSDTKVARHETVYNHQAVLSQCAAASPCLCCTTYNHQSTQHRLACIQFMHHACSGTAYCIALVTELHQTTGCCTVQMPQHQQRPHWCPGGRSSPSRVRLPGRSCCTHQARWRAL